MHYDGTWNDLELQRKLWKQGHLREHSDTIWNDIWNCNEIKGKQDL